MNPKLLHNRPLSDYENNDSFDFLIKATAIKNFLEQNTESLDQNKMLVLYGDWGSGKTSLMRHLESIIDKDIYKPIFFEAWGHEKDQNLALSLCDALTENVEGNNEIVKSFMKGAFSTLKGFASGITLKSSLLTGLGIDLEFSGKEFVEKLEKSDTPSFYKSNKEFKKSFLAVEEEILKSSGAQKLLVFIDDLDRCEPEHVLNLITALKLFFTYGNKVIFFCGIDKEAVAKAVKTKYNDVVKSDEYLEKVFDIGFNMPKVFSIKKLLMSHFPNESTNKTNIKVIEDFFTAINFTNPRHLKKVLTKYEILKFFKIHSQIPSDMRQLIPNIVDNDNIGSFYDTIFCLFMIILHEFYPMNFSEIINYDQKINGYCEIYYNTAKQTNSQYLKRDAFSSCQRNWGISDTDNITIGQILSKDASLNGYGFIKLVVFFSDSNPDFIELIRDADINRYNMYFTGDTILTRFCRFLINEYDNIIIDQKDSYYIIGNLFKMARYLF